jgi:hypothetical protein
MSTQMRDSIVTAMNAINDATLATRHQKRARVAVYLACPIISVRHSEITTMSHSRRDFLRTTTCALGSFALASTIENFGVVHSSDSAGRI